MLFSDRTWRRIRRLRRRAWGVGLVVATGCLYWGGKLAWAHSVTSPTVVPANVPAWTMCATSAYQDWVVAAPAATPPDAWSDPELHQLEQTCSQCGAYPSGGDGMEFTLERPHWSYSSLDGVTFQDMVAPPQSSGWDGKIPVWALATPQGINEHLPLGLQIDPQVGTVEARIWPEQRRAEVAISLKESLTLPESGCSLEEAWKHLPNATSMGCLRREVADALFASRPGKLRRLLQGAQNWYGLAFNAEVTADQGRSLWNRIQDGWIPLGAWGDFVTDQVCAEGVTGDAVGTLFSVAMEADSGLKTGPWEGRKEQQAWVGAGRLHLRHQGALQRLDWLATQVNPYRVVLELTWTAEAETAEEVATMGPDLESVYTIHPNVIAGR